jgi:hypothetical protein
MAGADACPIGQSHLGLDQNTIDRLNKTKKPIV